MSVLRFSSVRDQVAGHLQAEIARGRWIGAMPGRDLLAKELGVNRKTVEAALGLLEERGVLASAGAGKRRTIVKGKTNGSRPGLRVGILGYNPDDRSVLYMIELLHRLEEAGHIATYSPKTMVELKWDIGKIAHNISQTEADVWIVAAGTQPVLEWFIEKKIPAYALFGARRNVTIAGGGPEKIPAVKQAVRRLIELGHRRIVMLVRWEQRIPKPGAAVEAFLHEMMAAGLTPGAYHLPDWTETSEGLQDRLNQLFRTTPPTAIIIDDPFVYIIIYQYLLQHGIACPEQISLVSCDPHPMFEWMYPRVTHIKWSPDSLVRNILQWVNHLAEGKIDLSQNTVKANLIEGGTIGPVPRG